MLSSRERAALAAIGRVLEREDPRLARQLTADPREVPGPVEPSPGRPAAAAPVPDPVLGAGAPADADERAEGRGGHGADAGEEDEEAEPPGGGAEVAGIAALAVVAVLGLLVGLVAGRTGWALIGAAMAFVSGLWWRCLRRRDHGGPCDGSCAGAGGAD